MTLVKNFLKIFQNILKFLYNFITFSDFLYELEHWKNTQKVYIFSQNFSHMLITKNPKISKIFCFNEIFFMKLKSKS
jgi:hypothetical protein